MAKIVGIDVGTNSLGITVRDEDREIGEQIVYSTVHQFKSGVGKDRTGKEFSLAAQRTMKRSGRHINKVRRYRKWATLRMLIQHNCCPLTEDELTRWTHYDKSQGRRTYPTDIEAFNNWIKLDFNNDGKPDYTSPYELRAWLATTPDIDFAQPINRYKLGRALYHIAERRGFKSSKGETLKETEEDQTESADMKASELARSSKLEQFRIDNNLPTIGCALYELSKTQRVRASEYQAVRQQYKDEITYIFNFQSQLQDKKDFLATILSEKKLDGSIFYKLPLRSQKGNVGKCTLEPTKARCPQSRPEFELFTAWSFINNIKYGEQCATELTLEEKHQLYNEKFIRATDKDFNFQVIRHWIEHKTGLHLEYTADRSQRTINYPDDTKLEACKVTYRLQELLGTDWQNWEYLAEKQHTTGVHSDKHQVKYTWEDVWHVCFNSDDEEPIQKFASDAHLDETLMRRLFNTVSVGYASLSLKALRNINIFLLKGLLYNDACLYAKLPDILGDRWNDNLIGEIKTLLSNTRSNKTVINIVNALISYYKAEDRPWAFHDQTYKLQQSDLDDVQTFTISEIGDHTWNEMSTGEQSSILEKVSDLYQQFYASRERTYFKADSIYDKIKTYLHERYPDIPEKQLNKLYHHSKIQIYRPAQEQKIEIDNKTLWKKLLGSPALSSLRNPMALRVLHTLRNDINTLLLNGTIDDDDTRIVVEVARELNDANMRWAITQYDKYRRDENIFFESLLKDYVVTDTAVDKVRLLTEQSPELLDNDSIEEDKVYSKYMTNLLKRYKLWHEQKGICMYTGEPITLTAVLTGNGVDIEHTLPRSKSFDDSMANKTLCKSFFNRSVKCNRLPSELDNYEEILLHIKPWIDRVERLKKNIDYWRYRSKRALDKDSKDRAIRQRHLWEMEYDYWHHKVSNFRVREIKQGFRNNQLVDTSIIAKYATLFLKSLFTSVEVEKGTVTAAFRNIMQVPQKRRDNNSHHAVDALVLTYIPKAAQREKLLKLYFEQKELEDSGHDASHVKEQISREKKICGLNINLNPTIEFLRSTVLSRYTGHEQILAPVKRKVRIGGKIVYNADGKPRIKSSDSIRGKLFEDNFYGKIMIDGEEKVVIRRGGSIIKFEEKHIKDIVDKDIRGAIKKLTDEKGFEQAKKDGFYIDRPNGKRVPIRHVRCVYTEKPVVPVKAHAYVSDKEYKRNSYAVNGEVVLYALYADGKDRDKRCITLRKVAVANKRQSLNQIEDLLPEFLVNKKGKHLPLAFALHRGDLVIFRKEGEKLAGLTEQEMSKRLYRFCAMENQKQGKIKLQHHLYSGNEGSAVNTLVIGDATPLLIVSPSKQYFWVEGKDFIIQHGKIKAL